MKLTELLLPDRVRLIHDTKNISLIYDILDKYLVNLSPNEIRNLYSLRGDFIKNRLYITSKSSEALINLVDITLRQGLKYESITNNELRVDLYSFINKII